MSTKTLLISSVLSGFLLFLAVGVFFAGTSELLEQAGSYQEKGQYEQAEAIYLQIISNYPGTDYAFQAQKNLAILYVLWDKQPEADATLGQLVTDFCKHPGITQAVWQIAKEYQQTKKYDKALELHQYNVQQFSPDKHAMWSQVEIVYSLIDSGDAAADAAYDKLITVFSEQETLPKEIHQVAMKYSGSGQSEKAYALHQYNVEHFPGYKGLDVIWSQSELIRLDLQAGFYESACAGAEALLGWPPDQNDLPREIHVTAKRFAEAGKHDKAYELYRYNIEHFPKDMYAMWSQAEIVYSYIRDANDTAAADAAVDKLLTVFSKQPTLPKEVYQIADVYSKAGRYDKAIQLHNYNVDNFPANQYAMLSQVDIVYSYIRVAEDVNDTAVDAAVDKLLTIFSGQPTLPERICEVAKKLDGAKKTEKALQLHRYNVDHFPTDKYAMWSQVEIVESYIRDANDTGADEACDKLLSLFSDQESLPKEVYQVAEVYNKANRSDKAVELCRYIVERWPSSDHALLAQRDLTIRSIDADDEFAAQADVDKLLSDFCEHQSISQVIHAVAQHYERAKGNLEKALELHRYNVEHFSSDMYAMWSQVEIVKSHIRDGNDAGADEAFNKLLTEFGEQPTLPKEIYQVGDEYAKALNYDKAGALYQYVITNWPDTEYEMWAKSGMVKLDIYCGNDANVQPALDQLIADFNDHPGLPEAVFVIGEQYYYKAFDDPKKCIKVKSEESLYKAKDIWERIVAQWPESKSIGLKHAQYFSAVCYRRFGEYEKALSHYQKVVDNWPDYQYAWSAQYLIGICYEKLKNFGSLPESEASLKMEQAYKAVVEQYPDCAMVPTASLKLGHLNMKRSQKIEAVQYFVLFLATARPNDPRITSVESHLEKLKGEEK